ncbi:MAG: right-handed parallel beta-helix repeat-containing protein [Deferribacterales bacterium]
MSYKSTKEILNAVFDSSDGTLKTTYKTEGEVFNLVYDEDANALRVNIEGFTGGTGGIIDGEAATFADLPAASEHAGDIYIVHATTGVMLINRRQAGMYRSDGTSWSLLDVNLSADKVYYTGTLTSENVLDALEELNTAKAEMIYSSVTLNVANSGGDFASLNDALAYLNNYRLAPNVTVTIQIADGTYAVTNTINPNHPDLSNIRITGNTTDHTKVILDCSDISVGISLTDGVVCYMGGFTIIGCTTGLMVGNGATARLLYTFECSYCSTGVYALYHGCIIASALIASNNTLRGVFLLRSSNMTVTGNCIIDNNGSDGIKLQENSKANLRGSSIENGSISNNGGSGVYCVSQGEVFTYNMTIDGNGSYDIIANDLSNVFAQSCVYSTLSPNLRTVGNDNSYILA